MMIGNYRQFIQTTIKENDVLDKKFFLVIPLFALELGLKASKENLRQKIKTVLLPRRDQIIRQLNRVGLKAAQLTNQKLIELFYDIYNGQGVETIVPTAEISLNQPLPKTPSPQNPPQPIQQPIPSPPNPSPRTHPFVVEELEDQV